jgi:hypothetical protein
MGGAVAGSGGTIGSGGIAGRPDGGGGAGGTLDAGADDARADAANTRRIRCGNLTCSAPDQYCCIPDGSLPRCVSTVGGTCAANGNKIHCDDRTDCPGPNEICCAADIANGSSVADCRPLATCNGPKAQLLCDPQDGASCAGSPTNGRCTTMGSSTISGYPHCQ